MRLTLTEIASALDAELVGDGGLVIEGLAEPASAKASDLALATRPTYAETLKTGAARAALLWPGADVAALELEAALIPKRPRYAMSALTALADQGQGYAPGIHPTAVLDPSAVIAENVTIGPLTVIGPNANIAAGSVIGPQCYIGAEALLGANAYLRDHVSIGARVRIGDRFIAQPGAIIGGDGFSFVTESTSNVEVARGTLGEATEADPQPWNRIHSLGSVIVGDDVEIGAGACIDSGTIRPTRIGNGTKIDNLVHVGHNCVIGNDCLICGQAGLAGSVTIGNNVVMAGQSGVSDNLTIGDCVVIGGATAVLSSVPAGRAVLGYPATRMDTQIEMYKALRRLPRLLGDITALKKAVFKPGSND